VTMKLLALTLFLGVVACQASVLRLPLGSVVGPSGYITPDGKNVQFTADQIFEAALYGPSGIVSSSGRNIQFFRKKRSADPNLVGPSGIVTSDGHNIQFKTAGAYILLEGPSGYILSDGTLVQKRGKRSIGNPPAGTVFGPSGYVTPDGVGVQFTAEQASNFVLFGPSGVVTRDGKNIQFQ
jgi:hypothetical protein